MARIKKKKAIIDWIGIIFIVIVILINLFIFKNKIIRFFNDTFFTSPVNTSLTETQKLENFDYLYGTILNSSPKCTLDEYAKLYGISFMDSYDKYVGLIKNTDSDFEFYCVMKEILSDVPSFHNDIIFPKYSIYETLGCFNIDSVLNTKYVKPNADYWYNVLADGCADYNSVYESSHEFIYIDGSYIDEVGNIITDINGSAANDFIVNQLSTILYKYDYVNENVCKESFVVHEKAFTENSVQIEYTLSDKDGNISEHTGFVDNLAEYVYRYGHNFHPSDDTYADYVAYNEIYSYDDNDDGICYIMLNSMFGECAEISDIVEKSPNDTIILDIRLNSGGYVFGVTEYLYPPLFSENLVQNREWYVPNTSKLKWILRNDYFRISSQKLKYTKYNGTNPAFDTFGDDYLYAQKSYEFNGNATTDKTVYLLISNKTGSAADGFAALLKDNGLATLIGSNTGGEGIMNSFIAESLPNSKLVFIYMHSAAFNKDGSNNAVYGTAPDVYVNPSIDGLLTNMEIINNGYDPYIYENRVLWDNVLINALEIIGADSR